MGQDGAGIDQIKLGIECRRRLEQDSKTGLEQDSERGRLEQDSERGRLEQRETGYQDSRGRLGKQQDRVQGRAGQVQDEVSERYKVE
ncbi:hypothetical protein XELAEV_18013853mg [Xenopus laevis]|uniref:Uncharacterized protein n=1 Tax=Xenopus laevis TaxID=8355 RepID=A0A974HZJ1_XENLA|nr:hypothetical protein XELAEV_18013853mg [Xenopus laevis]